MHARLLKMFLLVEREEVPTAAKDKIWLNLSWQCNALQRKYTSKFHLDLSWKNKKKFFKLTKKEREGAAAIGKTFHLLQKSDRRKFCLGDFNCVWCVFFYSCCILKGNIRLNKMNKLIGEFLFCFLVYLYQLVGKN